MDLSQFTRGYAQGDKRHCERPWTVSSLGIVAATNGCVMLIRKAKKTDRYEEMPDDVKKSFASYLSYKPSRKAKNIGVPKLNKWAGKGNWGKRHDNFFPMMPGEILGKRFNRNYLALAFGLVDERTMLGEVVDSPSGAFLRLTGSDWRIVLMEVRPMLFPGDKEKKLPPVFKV